jgi:hypothetical protein
MADVSDGHSPPNFGSNWPDPCDSTQASLNKAVHPATAVLPPDARAAEAKYYEIIGSQAVLTEVQGTVHVRREVPLGVFPQGIEGYSFEAVADTIRQYP